MRVRPGVTLLFLVMVACGTEATLSGAEDPPPALSQPPGDSPVLDSTDTSTVGPGRFIEPSSDVSFPRIDAPDAIWIPPRIETESVNLTVVATGENTANSPANDLLIGLLFNVTKCVAAAPDVLVIEGSIAADVPLPDRLLLSLVQASGDPVQTHPVLVSVEAEGGFTLVLDGRGDQGPISLLAGDECRLQVEDNGQAGIATAAAEDVPGGVRWVAPPGSVHELGIGTVLSDLDSPGRGWAYANWAIEPLPFREILAAIPDPGEFHVSSVRTTVATDRACRSIETDVLLVEFEARAMVVQWRDCPERDRLGPTDLGPVDGYEGVFASSWSRTTVTLHGFVGVTSFKVEAPDLETAVLVLDHLEVRTNLAVAGTPDSPFRAYDLDEAIASALAQEDATEIIRVKFEAGWAVLAHGQYVEDLEEGEDAPAGGDVIIEYYAIPAADGWVVSSSGAASWDRCVHVGSSGGETMWLTGIVVVDVAWTIERMVDGEWILLETSNAAYLEAGLFGGEVTIENWDPDLGVRVRDTDGNEPACVSNQ